MYRHKKVYPIKYTDADAYDNLKISSLLCYSEESSGLSADELGFGYEDIKDKHLGFVVVNWYIEFFSSVKLGDELEIHTWPLAPKFSVFLRNYEFFVNGEKVGVASARWCMIDTRSFAVMPAGAFFKEGAFDNYNTERSVDFKAWKIPRIEGNLIYSKRVAYSDYDHYFHVNNTKYADFLMDVFSVDEIAGKYAQKTQISYVKQCKYGERIDFYREDFEGYSVVDGRVDGELRVQLRVELV